jgi:pantoate--beta-alanine ligase
MAGIIREIGEIHRTALDLRRAGKRVAVVPTMGALHDGHLALIREAKTRAEAVITTVFVNPAQFGPGEDFERYPRDLERDTVLAASAGSTHVFAPGSAAMYPFGFRTYVDVGGMDAVLEGKARPGHFRGVATIVLKLLHITHPHCVVFGQKDAQQVVVVRRMLQDLDMDVEMVVVPTVREPDGLALSSRNAYLTPEQRREAPVLYASLQEAERRMRAGERSASTLIVAMTSMITGRSSGVVDYVSVADAETLREAPTLYPGKTVLVSLAVRFGTTRLIDNVVLTP